MDAKPMLKDWINIVGGLLLVILIVYATIKIMSPGFYDAGNGMNNFFPFIPTGITTFVWIVVRIIVEGDVSTNMCFLLVFLGFVLLILGFVAKEENTKNAMFGGAGGLLGLGLGVPFGESLKNVEFKKKQTKAYES